MKSFASLIALSCFAFYTTTSFAEKALEGERCAQPASTCILEQSLKLDRVYLAEDKPPMPGCKRECTPMKKCTPGPCKRVGDQMVCEKEVCTTVQSCGWVCPQK